jgi:hypothetical protein
VLAKNAVGREAVSEYKVERILWNMRVARALLFLILTAATVVVWMFCFRMPMLGILAGPMNGALIGIAVLAGFPGRRGRQVQLLSLGLYGAAVFGVAGGIAGRILPWPSDYYLPRYWGLFIGIHGEGILGVAGMLIGGLLAATISRRTAQLTR